ncbi:hypothetical protein Tco_0434935, partial [Tanacetum coccineum]
DDDVWGSTDEDINKDKNEDDDEDDVNEEKEYGEEEEEETANSEHEEDDTKGEDQNTEEEAKGDDQTKEAEVEVPDLVTNKETLEFLQSTFSHLISLNFTTKDPAAIVINFEAVYSFLHKIHALDRDVQELKQTDHSAATLESIRSQLPFIVKEYLGASLPDAFQKVLQSHTEGLKKKLTVKKAEYKEFIEESVTNKVKNQMSKILSKAVSDFATPVIQSTIKETLEQTPIISAQSSSESQSSFAIAESLTEFELKKILMEKLKRSQSYRTANQHKILYDGLVNSYILDKHLFESYVQTVSLERNREDDQDEDPPSGPNQGKETKIRRTRKEAESSKKSSTPKESTKGKPPSKSSKISKYKPADQSVKEPEHEVQMDFKELTFKNMANDADVPHVDPKPRILKPDWLPQPLRLKTPEPDWNTVKTIDDAPEHPWFNEMINAEKPPLTFDEFISKPIEFSAYAMNCLKLNKLTREVLVGPMFNQLKGTCKSCVELEYNMEE